jgi:hypothetical protein
MIQYKLNPLNRSEEKGNENREKNRIRKQNMETSRECGSGKPKKQT